MDPKKHDPPAKRREGADANSRPQDQPPWSAVALITQLGLVVALCIVGSVLAGVYLDRLVGSNGILVLVMILVGLVAAGVSAWKLIKQELPWNR